MDDFVIDYSATLLSLQVFIAVVIASTMWLFICDGNNSGFPVSFVVIVLE